MARLNTRKRDVQLGTRQQEAHYFPIVKYIYPDKRLGPGQECPNEMHGKGLGFRVTFLHPRATTQSLTQHTAIPLDATAVLAQDPNCEFSRDDVILRLSFFLTSPRAHVEESSSKPIFFFLLSRKFIFVEMQSINTQ